jgi:hypothetical protein
VRQVVRPCRTVEPAQHQSHMGTADCLERRTTVVLTQLSSYTTRRLRLRSWLAPRSVGARELSNPFSVSEIGRLNVRSSRPRKLLDCVKSRAIITVVLR